MISMPQLRYIFFSFAYDNFLNPPERHTQRVCLASVLCDRGSRTLGRLNRWWRSLLSYNSNHYSVRVRIFLYIYIFFLSFAVSTVLIGCMGCVGERVLDLPGLFITTTHGQNFSLQLAIDSFVFYHWLWRSFLLHVYLFLFTDPLFKVRSGLF